jgi:ACR3 family arsenite efflux pump ArsB
MVSAADAIGLVVILSVNSAVAALLTRFFRVRLDTSWGSAVYVAFIGPVVLLGLTLVLSGVLSLGGDLGSTAAVLLLTIALPLSLGVSFDYFWMPAPEEVELPEKRDSEREESRV